jgi:hypothetical protein
MIIIELNDSIIIRSRLCYLNKIFICVSILRISISVVLNQFDLKTNEQPL